MRRVRARRVLSCADPCHSLTIRRLLEQQTSPYTALFDGRYWARTSGPSLSIWCRRSRQFAWVRSGGIVERNRSVTERLSERERTPILATLATASEPCWGRALLPPVRCVAAARRAGDPADFGAVG